jgi:integrase/recombinase XerD
MRYGDKFNEYCEIRRCTGIKEATLDGERDIHKHFWSYLKAIKHIGNELNGSRSLIQEYAREVNCNIAISNYSKRNRLQRLRPFYREAVKQEWILDDPMDTIILPKEEHNPIKVLTVKQMKALLEMPDISTQLGIRNRTMMELMYSSALRRSEILQVKAEDIGEDYRTIKVMGKGDKEVMLPVGRMAAHFLAFHLEHIWPKMNKFNRPEIFLSSRTGEPLGKTPFYLIIRAYADKLGLSEKIGPHVFRYSICTHLAELNVDIRLIQEFMRHEKISTTARYIKQSFEQLQKIHQKTHPRSLKSHEQSEDHPRIQTSPPEYRESQGDGKTLLGNHQPVEEPQQQADTVPQTRRDKGIHLQRQPLSPSEIDDLYSPEMFLPLDRGGGKSFSESHAENRPSQGPKEAAKQNHDGEGDGEGLESNTTG